ncbi:MAG: class I SAM-dependent methyltransferase [Nocardioides sp.]|nr:class I SAM-dependent methyltransferase [Nocardioides sp.]
MRIPGLGGWSTDPLWAPVYDWTVEHPRTGGLLWAMGLQSDLRLLYASAEEIGRLRAGARVLDVPCGGGVALRGLRAGQGLDYVAVDIAPTMLARAAAAAVRLGVEDQVTTRVADVAALPFDDESFDLVVSFTGLHCFADPAQAVIEMVRVLRPGGVVTGSAIFNDTGLRFEPMRRGGRLANLLGPGCRVDDVRRWLTRQGMGDVTVDRSGAIGYFRGVKR